MEYVEPSSSLVDHVLRSCSLTLSKHVGLSYLLCLLRVRKPTAYSSGKQPHGVTRTRQTSDLKK